MFSVDEVQRQQQLTKLTQDLVGKARLLAEAETQNAKLRGLLERAITALEHLNSGTAFEKPHLLREEMEALK